MSQLPHFFGKRDCAKKVQNIFDTFGDLPVTADKIAKASLKDTSIATVLIEVQHGSWSHLLAKLTLIPYHRCHHELSVIDKCLL